MNLSVPAAGDVFSGAVEGQGGGGVSTIGTRPMRSLSSTIGRTRSERAVKKAALGFRVFGFAFCLISFLVMAADVKKGWALDSFHRYVEFSFVFIQPKSKLHDIIDKFVEHGLRSLAIAKQVEPAKLMQNNMCPLGKVSHKGTVSGNKSICGSNSKIPPLSRAASKCHSCGNMRCQCSLQNDFAHASFMDLTLERSVGQDRGAFTMDHEVKSMLTSTMCKSDPESDVAGSSRKKKDWKGSNKKKHQGSCHWVSIHIMKVRIHSEDCICMKAMQILMQSILGQRNAKAHI